MNKRKQIILRGHYDKVKDCYECDGSLKATYKCHNQIYNSHMKKCVYKIATNNDLKKISNGNKNLTFPILEEIIRRVK